MTYFEHNRLAYLAELRATFPPIRPTTFVTVGPVETSTPREILAELRAQDPRAAAMLGELVVLDDDGNVEPESIDALVELVRRHA